jgi:hypothetical protein
MKFKRLLFSISAALVFLLSPSSSLAGWGGGGWHGGGGWGGHGGGWHGGWHGGWWHGGWWHGGHFYNWGWWPGYGWGWWGWGGWYPYWAWGEYPYGYWNGGYGSYGDNGGYGDSGGYGGGHGEPPGAQSETSAIQSRLANLGFYHGPIDGKVGPGTESALKAFQAQHGMRASGQIDDETLNALGLAQGR